MKLPSGELAIVERQKIVDYLLNGGHPDNRGKAQFFVGLGFSADEWELLARALLELAVSGSVVKHVKSPFGRKYVVHGRLRGSKGASASVQSIWIIDDGEEAPRLVTAYPH